MAGKTLSMSIIKQMIRLRQKGEGFKPIARIVGTSRNTVKKYFHLIDHSGWDTKYLLSLEDHQLESMLSPGASLADDCRYQILEPLLPEYEKELKRVGVNRWVLWGEYRALHPTGYSYTQFCYHVQQYLKKQTAVMHFEHLPGDKHFMDFTGKKLSWVDRSSGEIMPVEVYVAVLGYSQLTYVEGTNSQKKEDYIQATCNSLEYFKGVSKVLITDNLKSGVTQASKYEAVVNSSFLEMANHYGTAVLPTRSLKPRDKALVEKYVSLVYSRIFAPLRDRIFFSLEELNEAIWELLDKHNHMLMQDRGISRWDLYQEEKQTLTPLPSERFEIHEYRNVTVMKNTHVRLGDDKHYYSVPYRYIGEKVKIAFTTRHVSIYYKNERIAMHMRNLKPFGYTTLKEHLPSTHQFVADWNPDKFIEWARKIDPQVEKYIKEILGQKVYPEQSYRSCVGILSMDKKVGRDRLIAACKRADDLMVYNYKFIDRIIRKNLEDFTDEITDKKLPVHENIRGKEHYC
jgi:transposase